MAKILSDNIEENLITLRQLSTGMNHDQRKRAKAAAMAIEKVVLKIVADYPKDPAIGVGIAIAIFTIAERLVQQSEHNDPGPGSNLIHLAN